MQVKSDMSRETPDSRQSMRAFLSALEMQATSSPSHSRSISIMKSRHASPRRPADLRCAFRTSKAPPSSCDADGRQPAQFTATFCRGLPGSTEPIQAALIAAIEKPLPHRVVASAPCQEAIVAEPALAAELPIPRFFEKEAGPYITAGAIVAKDRASGPDQFVDRAADAARRQSGLCRYRAQSPSRSPGAGGACAGRELDIAVCIGNHPAVLVAACLYLGLGDDELPIAGALLGEPLEVVRCTQLRSAGAGTLRMCAGGNARCRRTLHGGGGQRFHGMYENYGAGIVATFTRLTRRRDAIFQVVLPGYHPEHCLLGGVAIAAGLAARSRNAVPSAREVAVGIGGAGRLHAVVALRAPRPGEARKAMFAVWAAVNLIKQVIVVDDDIDPWNTVQVEWAMATRVKPDRDFVILPRCAPTAPNRWSRRHGHQARDRCDAQGGRPA